ncbi:hypothetical protein AB0T83_17280 [Fluviibacterium sp. DFM31]|uniref:GHMP kinase C-terminal domain-containing protein n=1 Tax=Meridianimarinicoccus marinus TaxID=3231483 RepID=A0ABV3LAD8_9RHOB
MLEQSPYGAAALGARLTGGGFGGSIVVLVADDRLDEVRAAFPKSRVRAATWMHRELT